MGENMLTELTCTSTSSARGDDLSGVRRVSPGMGHRGGRASTSGEAHVVVNRSSPPGTVVPCLVYEDVREAILWLCDVFGFEQHHRWERDGVVEGAHVLVGEGSVFLRRQRGAEVPPTPGAPRSHSVMVDCPDADAQYERIRSKGGTLISEPATHPFGERQFSAEDLAGHHWTFSQSVADVAAEEWGGISEAL